MAKTNKVVTDISGNVVTYYGCATIQDACELGGVQAPVDANRLVTVNDVLDKHPYNVGLIDEPNIEYSKGEQIVAYDDLNIQQLIELPFGNENQKLGVLRLDASMNTIIAPGGTADQGYLTKSGTQIPKCTIDTNNTFLVPGYIKVQIQDFTSEYIAGTEKRGFEIVLQNFLSNVYDEFSLKIKSISLKDATSDGDATVGSDYSTTPDGSDFNIPDSQKRIVVENGQQKICGMIKPQSTDSKYLYYNNFDTNTHQTLSLMLISTGSDSIGLTSSDLLYSMLEVEFEYLAYDEDIQDSVQATSKLSIDLWFKNTIAYVIPEFIEMPPKDDDGLPEVEDNETGDIITIDPDRTILYTTDNGLPLDNYTDAGASEFAGQVEVENHGYATLSTGQQCGYIQYVSPLTIVGCNNLFQSNTKVTTVTLPEGIQKIDNYAFAYCPSLSNVKIPTTVTEIGEFAFYTSGLQKLALTSSQSNSISRINLQKQCFYGCSKLKELSVTGSIVVGDLAFSHCSALKNIVFPLNNGQVFPIGYGCFEKCSSLQTDLLQHTWGQGVCLGAYAFAKCTSLTKITLNGFANWFPFSGAVDPEMWFAWLLTIIPLGLGTPWMSYATASHAFDGCIGLKTIIINDYVDTSGKTYYSVVYAGFRQATFIGCKNVEKIYCNSVHPPYLGIQNINRKKAINPKTCCLYIPQGRVAAYNSKAQWGDFPLRSIIEYTPEQFEAVK